MKPLLSHNVADPYESFVVSSAGGSIGEVEVRIGHVIQKKGGEAEGSGPYALYSVDEGALLQELPEVTREELIACIEV